MKLAKTLLLTSGALLSLFLAKPAQADDEISPLLDLAAQYLQAEQAQLLLAQERPPRRRPRRHDFREFVREHKQYRPGRPARGDYAHYSYTSPPLRGGSSRRTRIIQNPYSNRIVTGITLTGIDDGMVHIKDVVSYPGRHYLSPLGYTLSGHLPPHHINTWQTIDYISVAAKRKEFFTVTFHYD